MMVIAFIKIDNNIIYIITCNWISNF